MILAFLLLAIFIWAVIATVAAVDAQDRYADALDREDRLRRELYGDSDQEWADLCAAADVERVWGGGELDE